MNIFVCVCLLTILSTVVCLVLHIIMSKFSVSGVISIIIYAVFVITILKINNFGQSQQSVVSAEVTTPENSNTGGNN